MRIMFDNDSVEEFVKIDAVSGWETKKRCRNEYP